MYEIYLILVIILFALAISDLIVGVSNDAVNFLNSAIGSKAAPKWIIFLVASLGVLAGSVFSSGMMEVARKGIFNPEMFMFSEIMIIFLAVMITDVILLDTFNTLGMPTSTTVSIVFELLGSAVAVALVKMGQAGEAANQLASYINSDKALLIITGILLSVIIAFSTGAIVQWLTRLLFSFRYDKRLKWFGSLYGGIAIAAMTYFMIIKGAKNVSIPSVQDAIHLMKDNLAITLVLSFVVWTVIIQLLRWIFKIDILKVIVLVGTFALAMAFAGNDLVNFIGVPIAAFDSFKGWAATDVAPDMLSMAFLSGKVPTPVYMLIIAGFVMIVTLLVSRKAKSVLKTSIDLSRQSEGEERFGSSAFSRMIVSGSMKIAESLNKITPQPIKVAIAKQFETIDNNHAIAAQDKPAFDKVRAASNLIVASILISIGTSLKLPLSTTYVTFMVAMGTSLSDRAWGRDSAVYRISGVFAVIGGWFLTAFIAFTVAFIVAQILSWGGFYAIFAMVIIALFVVVRTQISFRKKNNVEVMIEDDEIVENAIDTRNIIDKANKYAVKAIISTSKAYTLCFDGFFSMDRAQLKNAYSEVKSFNKKAKKRKDGVYEKLEVLQQDTHDTGHFYVQVVGTIREIAHSIRYIVEPIFTHFENRHSPFTDAQVESLNQFNGDLSSFLNQTLHLLKEEDFEKLDELITQRDTLLDKLDILEKNQIKMIKKREVSTRNSMLYFNILKETKNMLLQVINLVKSQRDFILQTKESIK